MSRIAQILMPVLALAAAAAPALAAGPRYEVQVKGLACPFCAYGVEKRLKQIDGVSGIETHIKDGAVIVTMEEGATLDKTRVRKAIRAAGFTLGGFRKTNGEQ